MAGQDPTYSQRDLERFREFWADEVGAAWLYRELARRTPGRSAALLRELAEVEDDHARHWRNLLEDAEGPQTEPAVPFRQRALAGIARVAGVDAVVPVLIRLEAADATKYLSVDAAPETMSEEETQHGQALARIAGIDQRDIAAREGRHRTSVGGALRAGTFGVNDGLVSNLALVMGVAGGTSDQEIVLLAGVAGLIAGAMSMAAGEWISVKSQRELYEHEIEVEREELRHFPEEERRELVTILKRKGVGSDQAEELSDQLMVDDETALDTLVREELGLDPGELGSPWVAAVSSFFAFAVGAFIPIVPFLFTAGTGALLGAGVSSAIGLALVGFVISLLTGRSGWFSAARMVLIGAGAATVTYGIGSLVGVAVG